MQSFRVPGIDPRVLRFRYSTGGGGQQHANIIRPLLQLVERQNSSLATLPRMEKKLEEVTKRLEIFSELNDAYQALIENLKGIQQEQMQKIELLQSTIEGLQRQQPQSHSVESAGLDQLEGIRTPNPSLELPADLKIVLAVDEDDVDGEDVDMVANGTSSSSSCDRVEVVTANSLTCEEGQSQLETEIIYDFVV